METMSGKYKEQEDTKRWHKELSIEDEVMVHLWKERFLVGMYNTLKIKKFEPCMIL